MKEFKTMAHINSIRGKPDEITVYGEDRQGEQTIYYVDYRGVKCTAIFNVFTNSFYADDVYGRIEQ